MCRTSERGHGAVARGFTLLELLIVICIIVILATMTLVAAKALGIGSKKTATGTILAAVRKGMELAIANKGSGISPAEHPLAGSRPGRGQVEDASLSAFQGIRGRFIHAVTGQVTGGSLVTNLDVDGEALKGAEEWFVGDPVTDLPARRRVQMGDDVFIDKSVPILYGAQRQVMGVIGSDMEAVTWYRRLPRPKAPALEITGPYDNTRYPNTLCLVRPTGTAHDNKRAIEYLFGSSSVLSELSSLKAVFMPPDDLPENRIRPPASASPVAPATTMDNGGRVWSEDGAEPGDGAERWGPGRVRDGTLAGGGADWKLYRLRGLGLYDAWGQEIFFSHTASGSIRLLSAGNDGALRWDPGLNHTIETDPDATEAVGDDKDGERDNVRQEVAE